MLRDAERRREEAFDEHRAAGRARLFGWCRGEQRRGAECRHQGSNHRRSSLQEEVPTEADGPPSGAARELQTVNRGVAYFLLTACFSCFPARNAGAMDALI